MKRSFTLPCDVEYIDISFEAGYHYDSVYFTGAELQKQPLYYYTTDQNGDIIQSEAPEPDDFDIDYSISEEDEFGRIKYSVSAAGVGQLYSYDENDNIISSAVTNGQVKMETFNTYTDNGNRLVSTTDPMGNTLSYNYNPALGTLDSITDSKGNATSYTYDSMQRLTGVSLPVLGLYGDATQKQNSYTYENDRLKTVGHNGFTYTFDYDQWGNLLSSKAGNQTLFTNTFMDNISKLLDTITFGNGQFR